MNPPQALLARTAGALWIVLAMLLALAMSTLQDQPGDTWKIVVIVVLPLTALIAFVGMRVVIGHARDTRGFGVASLILGVWLLFGAFTKPVHDPISHAAQFLPVVLLLASGTFALRGRSAYREWRPATSRAPAEPRGPHD